MKAVNLIPVESRRGGDRPSKSGGAVYGLLGLLAVGLLVLVGVTLAGRSIDTRTAEVAAAEQQASAVEAQAVSLHDYTTFASLRKKRVDTVRQLSNSRFDWSHVFHELARVMPATISLTSVSGSVSGDTAVDGGTANPLRSALPNPALSIEGCGVDQNEVARFISRLRLMDDVVRVSLSSSATPETESTECEQFSTFSPVFSMVVFYKSIAGVNAGAAATTAAPTSSQALAGANGTATTTATTPAAGAATPPPAATPPATTVPTPAASELAR